MPGLFICQDLFVSLLSMYKTISLKNGEWISNRTYSGKLNHWRRSGKTKTFISMSPTTTTYSPIAVAAKMCEMYKNVNKGINVSMYRHVPTHCGSGKCVNQNGLSAPNCYHYPRNKFDSQRRRFFKLIAESFLLETTIIACVFS